VNRIDSRFAELAERGEKALICFLVSGDPNFATTEKLVTKVSRGGADIVELGIPFSDPLADGPSIQAASYRAINNGATVKGVLDNVRSIRLNCQTPIVLMTYYNPVHHYGLKRFAREAAEAGADGVIITDLPPEESTDWKKAADAAGLATIFLLAPTSTKERIRRASNMASGFIYCVSRTGVTGARNDVPNDLRDLVKEIKSESGLPVVVGFGISKAEHVRQVNEFADGAVVGSALVNLVTENITSCDLVEKAGAFVRELKLA
jgi:tryptophan synthase alpha chain